MDYRCAKRMVDCRCYERFFRTEETRKLDSYLTDAIWQYRLGKPEILDWFHHTQSVATSRGVIREFLDRWACVELTDRRFRLVSRHYGAFLPVVVALPISDGSRRRGVLTDEAIICAALDGYVQSERVQGVEIIVPTMKFAEILEDTALRRYGRLTGTGS
jgi:hypothetical protein